VKENSNFTENGEKNFSHNTLKMCPTIAMIFFHRKVSKKYTKWVSSLSFQFVQNLFISITILSFCLLFSNTAKGQFCGNPASTVELTVTASIQQTSTYSSGKRAFLFSAISGYTYTFSTCSTTTGDTKLRLYSSSTGGTELAVSDNDCGANGKQSEIIWVCPTTGDYSILLTKRNCKNLNFDASVDYYYVSPDPCEGVTLTTNAGTDISLCQGSSLSLAGTSNTTYDQVTFGHCASSGNMDFATSNTFVAFNGETSFSNPTGKTTAYTDYSSSIFAEVVPGQTYADALTLRINSDGNWVIAGKAWIDWNGNNIFEASEAYDLGTTTNSTDGATTLSPLSITVPASAVTGYVKMRVTSRWDSPSTECETGFDGETEDYSILVTSPVSYSWSPTTELNDPLTPQPICSATTNTTYTLTATNSNGCSVSDDLTTTIQEPVLITSQETVTDNSTCGEFTLQVSSNAVDGTGVWSHSNGFGLFDEPSEAITQFTTNTFNQLQTLTWTTSAGACAGATATITAQFNQPITSLVSSSLIPSASWLWGGLTDVDYNTAPNWFKWDGSKWLKESSSIPAPSHDIYVIPNITAGLCVSDNNFLVASGDIKCIQVLDGGNTTFSGDIQVTGDIINNGTISGGVSTVTFNGSSDQTISGTGTSSFDNLTINKTTTNVIFSSPVNVESILNMTSGNIINPNHVLTIGTSSSNSGSIVYSSGIVTGKLRRYFSNGSGSTLFPIGNTNDLRDFSIDIQGSPGTNQYLTAQFISGAPQGAVGDLTNGLPLTTTDGQLIENYNNDGYWEISPTNDDYNAQINSKNYTIDFHLNNFSNVNDFSQMRIIKSAGSNTPAENHVNWLSTTHNSSIGTNNDFVVSTSSVGFSFFASGGDDNGALPVELISFAGNCIEESVNLEWETASEYNSSHFILEYSRTGEDWSIINHQDAALNSTELISYQFLHLNSHSGDNYYRLIQVDIDGSSTIYNIINVNCENNNSSYFNIYPNPSNGNIHLILNDQRISGDALVRILDTKGNLILNKAIDVKDGINMYIVDEEISSGIYYININNGNNSTTIVKHIVL
jgi:hypothetical protein